MNKISKFKMTFFFSTVYLAIAMGPTNLLATATVMETA
jgi:hypothetical protein